MATEYKRYARVVDGVIVEGYVSELHIKNRKHDARMYHEVVYEEKPSTTRFENLVEKLRVSGKVVIASYQVVGRDVDDVLAQLHRDTNAEASAVPGEVKDVFLNEVDPEVIGYVLEKVKELISSKLNSFAKTRDYADIVSLCSYATSTIEKFQTEGQRGVVLRDQCYAAIYAFLEQMNAGAVPVPKSKAEIEALLPELIW